MDLSFVNLHLGYGESYEVSLARLIDDSWLWIVIYLTAYIDKLELHFSNRPNKPKS